MAHWFAMDPIEHLRDPPVRQMIRVAAYMSSQRIIAEARQKAGG